MDTNSVLERVIHKRCLTCFKNRKVFTCIYRKIPSYTFYTFSIPFFVIRSYVQLNTILLCNKHISKNWNFLSIKEDLDQPDYRIKYR